MNTKNTIPGFTAETALLPTIKTYRKTYVKTQAQGMVVPQMPFRECYYRCRSTHRPWLSCLIQCL